MQGDTDGLRGAEVHRVRLKDGARLTVLLLSQDDAERGKALLRQRIQEGYAKLSARSRRLRFISPPHQLAPWQLDYLTDLDPARGAIWVARDDAHAQPLGAGLARCMRIAGEPDTAEIALTVLDEYQNRGLGRIFLDLIIGYARSRGLHVLRAYVLPENGPMLHLLKGVGAGASHLEDGLLRWEWTVR